jgi:cysteinyl-tRNA synthetase
MKITFFNSLGRKLEEFKPITDGKVGMYCCGPTVYAFATLGNMRTYLFEDILRRMLEYNGLKVKHVMNITDVGHLTGDNLGDADTGEDRMEKAAKTEGRTAWEIADFYTKAFLKDAEILNIERPEIMPKATDHIQEQIDMVRILESKGYAYITSDGIYFDVSKWKDYGKLSGQKLEDKKAGARVELNEDKRNAIDFALWKFSPEGEVRQMEWDNPWGRKGFPGWHIECSAMSSKYLGQPFDIHCGGIDHIPVHHENEIAQSEAANDKKYVNYWIHGEFMMVNGRRMGKSEGNAYLVKDLLDKSIDPLAFRYLNLGTHYRIQLNFTWEGLKGSETALQRLRGQVQALMAKVTQGKVDENYQEKFLLSINYDLNTAEALSLVWELLKSDLSDESKLATILDFDKVLGLKLAEKNELTLEISDDLKKLLDLRMEARKSRNFAESDRLREEIKKLGYQVKDMADGQDLSKL